MTIRLEGLDKVLEKLGSIEKVGQALRPEMEMSGKLLVAYLKIYPPKTNTSQPFKTLKQRRFFFYALKAGIIEVPYRRRNQLSKDWTYVIENNGTLLRVGNNMQYGPLVQGDSSQQALFHRRNNWRTITSARDEKFDDVKRTLESGIRRIINE